MVLETLTSNSFTETEKFIAIRKCAVSHRADNLKHFQKSFIVDFGIVCVFVCYFVRSRHVVTLTLRRFLTRFPPKNNCARVD